MEIKNVFKRPYIFWGVGIFMVYLTFNIIISQFYVTLSYIPYYLDTIKWGYLLLSLFFTFIIGILVSISIIYGYLQYMEKKKEKIEQTTKKNIQTTVTGASTLGGLAIGVCSACGSILPSILSIFGISASFASLPFQGLEIQVLLIVILGFNIYFLQK